jgi:hypothetical protein
VSTDVNGGVLEYQLCALRKLFPNATIKTVDGGAVLVTVPEVPLPDGWNQKITTVRFLAPVGFPLARPDCFWADPALRLVTGAMPQNGGMSAVPGLSDPHTWFSWHLQSWDPLTDSLLTFVRVIQNRFLLKN